MTSDTYQPHYVVEAYLVANAYLPVVKLTTTVAIGEEYDKNDLYVRDALVEVRLLRSDSSVAEVFSYSNHGTYRPVDTVIVKAGRLYQLHISLPSGEELVATTRVPGDFKTVNRLRERYLFEGEEPIRVQVSPSYYPGRPTYYAYNVDAVEPKREKLTPFFYELVEKEGLDIGIYYRNSIGVFSENSMPRNEDGSITIGIPWVLVAFYGENDIVVNALDDNLYDFIRSQNTQGGLMSPGNRSYQNTRFNIRGGIGIFGSMASDTNRVVVLPREG